MKSLFPVTHFKTDHSPVFSTPQFHCKKISCPLHYNRRVAISRDFQTNTARDTKCNQPNTDLVLQETRYKKEDSNPHVHLFIPSTHHKVGENEREKYIRRETQGLKPQKIYPSSLADKLSSDRPRPSRTTTDTIVSPPPAPPAKLTGWQRDVCHNLPQQLDISQGLGRNVRGRRRKRYTLKGTEMCSHAWTSFA